MEIHFSHIKLAMPTQDMFPMGYTGGRRRALTGPESPGARPGQNQLRSPNMKIDPPSSVASRLADELQKSHPVEASHIATLGFTLRHSPLRFDFYGRLHDGGEWFRICDSFSANFDTVAASVARQVAQRLSLRGEPYRVRDPHRAHAAAGV